MDDKKKTAKSSDSHIGTEKTGKQSQVDTAEEVRQQTDSIPGNQTDQPFTADTAADHGTDPSKLSDL
jgi:hypothetical protein